MQPAEKAASNRSMTVTCRPPFAIHCRTTDNEQPSGPLHMLAMSNTASCCRYMVSADMNVTSGCPPSATASLPCLVHVYGSVRISASKLMRNFCTGESELHCCTCACNMHTMPCNHTVFTWMHCVLPKPLDLLWSRHNSNSITKIGNDVLLLSHTADFCQLQGCI